MMSFRSHGTLQGWLAEFFHTTGTGDLIKVAIQDSSHGEDGGLIVVPLHHATTTVYLRPPEERGGRWRVIFEPQPDETALTPEQTRGLIAELAVAADLCEFLERKAAAHSEPLPRA
ncbi:MULTISPECIES: hypothetical protein [unclassified Microbacterium]|uniref:hypothetical protein n=1 Tax=unclassified Microbacterium TaxID=2609290 RepID=UPI0020037ED2|nr:MULTISPECIES: hypothetical protein [unclassified Microbacterium]